MNLRDILDSVAKKMLADFDASGAVQHRGSKGTVRESNLLDNYLRKYLPRSVMAEHSGEAITVDGEVSAQCDIMILDPSTPPFWDEGNYRVVPIECVQGKDRRHQAHAEEGPAAKSWIRMDQDGLR